MKRTNKYLSLALAIIMALSLCVTSFAAGETAELTIANPEANSEYNAYKIFDYTASGDAFSYTMSTENPWFEIVRDYGAFTFTKSATDDTVYVVTVTDGDFTAADAQAFAKFLIEHKPADAEGLPATDNSFGELALGYYLVDTNLGSLCSLVNAGTTQMLYEKNSIPTIEKKVKENANDTFADSTDADTMQKVYFEVKVNTGNTASAEDGIVGIVGDYTITDTLPAGMTFDATTLAINGWTVDEDYTVSYTAAANATAQDVVVITLKNAKLVDLGENKDIFITYQANVDKDAVINGANTNTVELAYDGAKRDEDTATVYTHDVNIFKFFKTLNEGTVVEKPLANAQFVLKRGTGSDTVYAKAEKVAADSDDYVIIGWGTEAEAFTFESPADGMFNIKGLDADTYYLEETVAPDGYNLLANDVTITIAAGQETAQTIKVENSTGAILPGTGGVGTTMFYVLGSVMMIGAAILLVTKKKMANEQ